MKNKSRVKDKQLSIRLNISDVEIIKKRAEKFGLSVSKYILGLVVIDSTDDNMRSKIKEEGIVSFLNKTQDMK